jgi:Bacterial Ig-like domain/Protein of unknown function (DUF642)
MTTYFVSSEIGNDRNAGTTATSPLASLQAAANLVKPGDTVEVMNGTYTGPYYGEVLTITTSGTANAPITFEAAPGQTPIIDSSGTWHGIHIEASYIIVRGFTVVGDAANYTLSQALAGYGTGSSELNGNGITVSSPDGSFVPNHIIIENNTVYNEPGAGITALGADYVQILNNVVHDNAHWSAFGASGIAIGSSQNSDTNPGVHDIISGNISYNNQELVPEYRAGAITDGEGIILDTNPGFVGQILVQGNTTYGNSGPGIESFLTDNAVITGNTAYGNLTYAPLASEGQIFINQSNNNTVTNNSTTSAPPPSSPVILSFSPDTGVVGDHLTDSNQLTLSGTAAANDTVTVKDGSTTIGTVTSNATGQWSLTTAALANGRHSFTATTPDGGPSAAFGVTIGANLVVNGGFETGDFTGWTLSGNVAPTIYGPQVFIANTAQSGQDAAGLGSVGPDGTLSQTIQTTAGQHYTLDFWLANGADGQNDFTAKWNGQTLAALANASAQGYTEYTFDVVGTASTSNLEFDFHQNPSYWSLDNISLTPVGSQAPPPPIDTTAPAIDTTAPARPTVSTFSPDSGTAGDGHTTATSLTFAGSGEANSIIQVFDGTKSVGTASVNASGTWSLPASNLTVGSHSFTATDTDAAGNASAASAPLSVTIDASSSPPPPATNLVVNGGFETGNLNGWTLSGNIAWGTLPEIYITNHAQSGGGAAGLGSMGSDGTLSQNIQTTAGQHYTLDFWLANEASGANDFTVKWNGQTLTALVNAPAQGFTEYTFDVVGTAGTSNLEFDAQQIPAQWNLDNISVTPVASSPSTPVSTDTNSAGSNSTPSSALVVTVDTSAPARPTVSSFSPDTTPTGDGQTTATNLTLSGKGEANSTIQLFDGTSLLGSTPVNAAGNWSIAANNLAVGSHSFSATDTDAAGNTSLASAYLAVTILSQMMAGQPGQASSGGTTISPPPSTPQADPPTLANPFGLVHT